MISEIQVDEFGIDYVSEVAVQRADGVSVGPVFRGRVDVGLCAEDGPVVGATVVVLLGVDIPGVPGGPYNVFYSVGRTVTRAQVASLAGDLPDTSTAYPVATAGDQALPLAPVGVLGFALLAGLFLGFRQARRAKHRAAVIAPPRNGGAAFRRPAGLVRNRAEFSSVGSGAKRWIG